MTGRWGPPRRTLATVCFLTGVALCLGAGCRLAPLSDGSAGMDTVEHDHFVINDLVYAQEGAICTGVFSGGITRLTVDTGSGGPARDTYGVLWQDSSGLAVILLPTELRPHTEWSVTARGEDEKVTRISPYCPERAHISAVEWHRLVSAAQWSGTAPAQGLGLATTTADNGLQWNWAAMSAQGVVVGLLARHGVDSVFAWDPEQKGRQYQPTENDRMQIGVVAHFEPSLYLAMIKGPLAPGERLVLTCAIRRKNGRGRLNGRRPSSTRKARRWRYALG